MSMDIVWKEYDNYINAQTAQSEPEFECYCEGGEPDILETSYSILCFKCGKVFINQLISETPEWTSYSDGQGGFSDSGNRCGNVIDKLTPISSMSSTMTGTSRIKNLGMWLSLPYEERILIDLKKRIQEITIINKLPTPLVADTLLLYKKFINMKDSTGVKRIHRGKIKEGIISVCFYYASKGKEYNLTSTYISDIFNIDKKTFSKCCRLYNEYTHNKCNNETYDATGMINRFTNKLNLSFNIQKLCKNIIKACSDLNLLDNVSPQSLSSTIIHFINVEMTLNIDIKTIGIICDISPVTITKLTKIITTNRDKIFNLVKSYKLQHTP